MWSQGDVPSTKIDKIIDDKGHVELITILEERENRVEKDQIRANANIIPTQIYKMSTYFNKI